MHHQVPLLVAAELYPVLEAEAPALLLLAIAQVGR